MNLLLILLISFILRIINLNQSFWLDEAAQVIESLRPLSSQFIIPNDFQPPLYHILLHFWMYLGVSEVSIRMLSVLLGVASVFLAYHIGLFLTNKKIATITALLLAFSAYHIWYSQEARPYILFVFAAQAATYFFIKKRWLLYSIFLCICLYSQYFAIFLILSHIVYILVLEKRSLWKFGGSVFFSLVLFSIWVPSFLEQLRIGTSDLFEGWKNIVSVSPYKAIPLMLAKFIFGRGTLHNKIVYFLILFPTLSIFLISLYRSWYTKVGRKILILFATPILASVVISFAIPIIAPQRLLFLLPLFYLTIVYGVFKMRARYVLLTIVFVTTIGGIGHYYFYPEVQREQWRQAVAFISQRDNQYNLALFIFPEPFAPFLWYNRGSIEALGIASQFQIRDLDLERFKEKLNAKKRIYLFQYLTGLTDPNGKTILYLENLGFQNTKVENFPGVGLVYIYDKK